MESDASSDIDVPHDTEVERAVLGLCLLGVRDHIATARRRLPAGWCWEPKHVRIWDVICRLDDTGYAADLTALARQATEDGADLTGEDIIYATKCYEEAPTAGQLDYYLTQAARTARWRSLRLGVLRLDQLTRRGAADLETLLAGHLDDFRTLLDELAGTGRAAEDSWSFVDLDDALNGGTTVAAPNVLFRDDGVFLLYPGRVHSIAGEPEGGKSWVAIVAAVQCIVSCRHVVYIDYEDTAAGIVSRLLALGATPDDIRAYFHYARPDRGVDSPAKYFLAAQHVELRPAFVAIDGVTEAMMMQGLKVAEQEDVASFYDMLPRYIAGLAGEHDEGPAVLLIDHVAKDQESRGRWAIGAQHKLAGISGAAYTLERILPFRIGEHGMARITVAKDRHSLVRQHCMGDHVAELHIYSDGAEVARWELQPVTQVPRGNEGEMRPTFLMEKVSRWLEINPGSTQSQIRNARLGRQTRFVMEALRALIDEGYVSTERGGHNSTLHRSARSYRINPDEDEDDDED